MAVSQLGVLGRAATTGGEKNSVPYSCPFPDEVHSFLLYRSWVRAYEALADFFTRKLGDR